MARRAVRPDKALDIETALRHLRAGRAVAYPTETFFALGADALDPAGVELVRRIKERSDRPIGVIAGSLHAAERLAAEFPDAARALAERFWPGPLTLVVRARDTVPLNLRAGRPTVAVRVSSHVVARALAQGLGGAITATSCNRRGEKPAVRPEQIADEILEALSGYVEGVAPGGRPSTLVDVTREPPVVLRKGAVANEALRRVVPQLVTSA